MRLLLLLLISGLAQAEIYRWLDDRGQVVYSQTPPADRSATTIKTDPAPKQAYDPQERLNYYRRLNQELTEKAEKRKQAKLKAEQAKKEREAKALTCAKAKESLAKLKSTPNYMMYDKGTGEYELLDEAKRQARYQELNRIIQKNCQ